MTDRVKILVNEYLEQCNHYKRRWSDKRYKTTSCMWHGLQDIRVVQHGSCLEVSNSHLVSKFSKTKCKSINLTNSTHLYDSRIVGVGFLGSLALTFIFLGCILSGKWWTLLIFIFYGFTPLPLLFVRNTGYDSLDGEVNKSLDIAMFFVTGMIVSTFAFPLLLARTPVDNPNIDATTAILTEVATILFYFTAGLFLVVSNEEEY